jgi:hypothetical protein
VPKLPQLTRSSSVPGSRFVTRSRYRRGRPPRGVCCWSRSTGELAVIECKPTSDSTARLRLAVDKYFERLSG